jgi:hypothetical protein
MSELSRGERLQIMLTQEELNALDDWRFAQRMPSRAAAVRELLRRGLLAEGALPSDSRSRSKDFGVVDSPDGHDHPDGHDSYRRRDADGGAEAG